MRAFGFARCDLAINGVGRWMHDFYRAGGLVTIDVGALERELRAAWYAPREPCGFALGGHFRQT